MSTLAVEPASTRPVSGFFQRQSPVYLILGSFLFLTVPLTALAIAKRDLLDRWHIGLLYIIGLGTTHFVLTFTIYFQSSNLRHFNSTWTNRILYFLIPAAIFVFFDVYHALQIALYLPLFDTLLFWGIRFFDFQHFGRQSYGVLQLFKGRAQSPFPAWARKAENLYFFGLTCLLMLTFLRGGRIDVNWLPMQIAMSVVGVLLIVLLAGFVASWKRAGRKQALAAPFAYFLLQSGSAALGIYSSALYLVCLAAHYVEYHVLMVPRCFHTTLDPQSRTDRIFDRLRRNRVIFYLVLLAVAGAVTTLTWQVMGMMIAQPDRSPAGSYRFLIALFDGLFVFHYFIESFIWKFSDPYYRKTLGPLYFSQNRPAAPAPAASKCAPGI